MLHKHERISLKWQFVSHGVMGCNCTYIRVCSALMVTVITMCYISCIFPQELDLLDSQNTVYKLIGPVLVKQDLDEAKATVAKRLEYINGEM